jgi:hypothetical protein
LDFVDSVEPEWFWPILNYSGSDVHLQVFEQGINLVVETPLIIAAVIGVFFNLVLPLDASAIDRVIRDSADYPVLEEQIE